MADIQRYDQYSEGEDSDLLEELSRYRNGYKGACYACEPVGELNVKLEAKVQELEKLLYENRLDKELHHDLITAKGIEEMLIYFADIPIGEDEYGEPVYDAIDKEDIGQYIAKLREDES